MLLFYVAGVKYYDSECCKRVIHNTNVYTNVCYCVILMCILMYTQKKDIATLKNWKISFPRDER